MKFKNINYFYSQFINELGMPDDDLKLFEYLTFLLRYSEVHDSTQTVEYTENHHILPRSPFNQHINANWNIVNLVYLDHIFVHELLAQAYNTRQFLRTLNFMKSDISKNHKILSIAAKKGWMKLKSNIEIYEKWKLARHEFLKNISLTERSRRSNKAWAKIKADPLKYAARCKQNSENWSNDLRILKSKQMKEYFTNNPKESSNRGLKRWASADTEYRKAFGEKIKKSLSTIIVKDKISTKLKAKWNEPLFRDKMKNRKIRQFKYLLISPLGEVFRRVGVQSILDEFNFSASLFRKFTNSNKRVKSKYLKCEKVRNTIGWTINKIS